MRVTLKTFGMLDAMIKEKEFSVPEGTRIGELINMLADRYGSVIREHLLPGGTFNAYYFIFVKVLKAQACSIIEVPENCEILYQHIFLWHISNKPVKFFGIVIEIQAVYPDRS